MIIPPNLCDAQRRTSIVTLDGQSLVLARIELPAMRTD